MYQNLLTSSFFIAATALLVGCGGGSENTCGEKTQSFAINFAAKSFDLKLGQATELKSLVTPESCRFDITYGVRIGSLPDGMTLVNGNVVGIPTKAGTFDFQISIKAVSGYQTIIGFLEPRSGLITVNVLPPPKPNI